MSVGSTIRHNERKSRMKWAEILTHSGAGRKKSVTNSARNEPTITLVSMYRYADSENVYTTHMGRRWARARSSCTNTSSSRPGFALRCSPYVQILLDLFVFAWVVAVASCTVCMCCVDDVQHCGAFCDRTEFTLWLVGEDVLLS